MKRFLFVIAVLILPGGIILLIFRLIRRGQKFIAEYFSRLKQKILS